MTILWDEAGAPDDWDKPDFYGYGKNPVHEWKNHVGTEVAQIWHTFTPIQKRALARCAQERAGREDWD